MHLSNVTTVRLFEIQLKTNLQGISFDDDSDEDADWKRKDLNEVEVSCAKAFHFMVNLN